MVQQFDVEACRAQFPALSRVLDGRPVIHLDGPAGSQVPARVADAVRCYMLETNANGGGRFRTSQHSDAVVESAHRAAADLIGSDDPDTIAFGPNMTTLTLSLARAMARTWAAGDEIVVTRLEHDANFTPWIQAAHDAGATVRHVGIRAEDCTLDLDELGQHLNRRTRLLAVTAASNAVGTLPPMTEIVQMAHEVGARVFVDAVHYAPHRLLDVERWGCDFLACSAYKFFGPHVGILWGRRPLFEQLPVYKLRPPSDRLPDRWMTGTQNHEGLAGTLAAIDYLADLGRDGRDSDEPFDRRIALANAFEAIVEHETRLGQRLLRGLKELPDIRVRGITDPGRHAERVPTFSFTHGRRTPAEIADSLGRRGIFVWHGNHYALPLTEAIGVEPGGVLRIGLLHYNTEEEVDRTLAELLALTDL